MANNFFKGVVDPTLFIRKSGKHILLVQIYVDDIIFASTDHNACNIFSKEMSSKFQMSMMGQMSFFLGLQVSQSPGGIFINQAKYALETLKKYGMDLSDPVDTQCLCKMPDHADDVQIQEDINREVLSFLEIDWLAGHQRNNEARQYQLQRLNTSPCLDVNFNKIPLYCDNKSAIALCCINVQHLAHKHIDIRHLSQRASGNLSVETLLCGIELSTCSHPHKKAIPRERDEQIVPRSQWLTIGKSNLLFNAQKIQKNPIFQISVDILRNTNFFQALTASANVLAIYLQQFWKTITCLQYTDPKFYFNLGGKFPILANPVLDQERLLAMTDPEQPSSANAVGDGNRVDFILGNLKLYPKENLLKEVQCIANLANKVCFFPKKPITTTPVKQTKPAPPPSKKETYHSVKLSLKFRIGKALPFTTLFGHQVGGVMNSDTIRRSVVSEANSQLPFEVVRYSYESSSTSDSERTESDTESGTPKGDKVQSEIVTSTVTSGVSIPVSDPEKAHEALAGPNPEPMQEDQTGSDSGEEGKLPCVLC
ncbi:retrovirus-related pol polyprotein from transposon TNT 1-94 [Tanacetum coccineum]